MRGEAENGASSRRLDSVLRGLGVLMCAVIAVAFLSGARSSTSGAATVELPPATADIAADFGGLERSLLFPPPHTAGVPAPNLMAVALYETQREVDSRQGTFVYASGSGVFSGTARMTGVALSVEGAGREEGRAVEITGHLAGPDFTGDFRVRKLGGSVYLGGTDLLAAIGIHDASWLLLRAEPADPPAIAAGLLELADQLLGALDWAAMLPRSMLSYGEQEIGGCKGERFDIQARDRSLNQLLIADGRTVQLIARKVTAPVPALLRLDLTVGLGWDPIVAPDPSTVHAN